MESILSRWPVSSLLFSTDARRIAASSRLSEGQRATLSQYFTPLPVAQMMADMFEQRPRELRILDAGAGVGILVAALVETALEWQAPPESVSVTACEIDGNLIPDLRATLEECREYCERAGVSFTFDLAHTDFISMSANSLLPGPMFDATAETYNAIILNPPYQKIRGDSDTRRRLQTIGVETSNLYSAFVWLALKQLQPEGELVAITPRSFTNGPYFRPFRRALISRARLRRLHVFEARDLAFEDDGVLQENIIYHVVRTNALRPVFISSSIGVQDSYLKIREASYDEVVQPDDPEFIIHIIADDMSRQIKQQVESLPASLSSLGLQVSTGRVVLFRARAKGLLSDQTLDSSIPLIYPAHFHKGRIKWPLEGFRKPSILKPEASYYDLLVPSGCYVLVKRFTSKEETRRVVAVVYAPEDVTAEMVGFENHLNYFHKGNSGLDREIAAGLSAYLNSTLVDEYFRLFNGHTQVNAADLRRLPYPSLTQLKSLGRRIGQDVIEQKPLDRIVQEELRAMVGEPDAFDPVLAKQQIDEALAILHAVEVPRGQRNERSALTLLALLNLKPGSSWQEATPNLLGITEMMDYFNRYFGVRYAPNTRETVRRQTIHQFLDMGLVVINPDDPERPTNSPYTCYQVVEDLLDLARAYQTPSWDEKLVRFLEGTEERKRLHEQEREMRLIPVRLPDGSEVTLTPGGQNRLIKKIVEEFCPRFTPGGTVVYIDDAGPKFRESALGYLHNLGVDLDIHGKMPDVIVHHAEKNWLVLVEAVTSHGPIDIKRHNELKELFAGSSAGLVFVTAFLNRRAMVAHLPFLAWETEVWIAASPSHLIHFNGERFLGPEEQGRGA